jgi:hypothetical protein
MPATSENGLIRKGKMAAFLALKVSFDLKEAIGRTKATPEALPMPALLIRSRYWNQGLQAGKAKWNSFLTDVSFIG